MKTTSSTDIGSELKADLGERYAIIKDKEALSSKVIGDYFNGDSELTSLFFDFNVSMKKRDILTEYGYIQMKINADTVVQYKDGREYDYNEPEFASEPEYGEVYTGNCMEFLESLNGQEVFRRYTDEEEYDPNNFIF